MAAELWLYLDAVTGEQKGPVPSPIIKKLLRKGLIQPQQLVWTQRLSEWKAIVSVEPFAAYNRAWRTMWYYMAENLTDTSKEVMRAGPVLTQQLVELFTNGDVDGMTLVWSQEVDDWKPIGDVPLLKEFLQEANDEIDRQSELKEQIADVPIEDQVFENESADAFIAEDGKRYVFDAESKMYVTPEIKIEDELASLREAVADTIAETQTDTTNAATTIGESTDHAEMNASVKRKRKKKKNPDKWKKSKTNTWVYVNGLPLDVTLQEVHDHFAKCGVIQTDIVSGEPRIKLYENKESGGLNGDGSICYMKEASVELAVQLLDKSQIRPEWPIDVSPAVFQQKEGEFVKRKKVKIDTRAKIRMFEKEKALSWNEGEINEPTGFRIVVIKHMFTPSEIEDESYEKELRDDIYDECSKLGEVSKITLFAKREDGVVVIKFTSSGSAAQCVDLMNGRFFAGRKLECSFWDGTDYTHHESKHEEQQRAEKFQEWLEDASSSESEDENEETKTEEEGNVVKSSEVHVGRKLPSITDDND
ncbi:rna-binding protein [Plasmopara halstedii]|uniref:Rna-binding protein n=1 Tax=Plasmopara halstedii TaxID=4781 RepID=A0A0N7L3Q1_PLAHL|nr:rna-binding protein [Plasmopara halstedii]CEG36499.1 rna-binding protein [Plasmopara halstedii]|eukprot:XP_024572868.1 rna-binding protein [Plasmopara halstedii]